MHACMHASTLLNGIGIIDEYIFCMCLLDHAPVYLAVDEGRDGEVPRRVGGHDEAQERPDPVVVERRDEHRRGAAGAEDVRPRPLVQLVVDVVDVAVGMVRAHAHHIFVRTQLAILPETHTQST